MFHLAWKMAVSLINSLPHPHFTTTTVRQEMPDCTRGVWEGLEGHGVLNEVTNVNGFSLTLEDELELHVFPHKVVKTLISGSQAIM